MTASPTVSDAIACGDHVCWADAHSAALHEGTVCRVFDRFVEVLHRDECGPRLTMVYVSRLATITPQSPH